MGLFTPNFNKPGPGIEKDEPPKKGLARFWEIFAREFPELIKLNLLFLVCCIPIVTIGAAVGGMTKCTVQMVRDLPNDVVYDFKRGFKENWKASTVAVVLEGLLTAGGLLGFIVYRGSTVLTGLSIAALILIRISWVYVMPMVTSTDLPLRAALQNSFLMGVMLLKHSLPAAIVIAAVVAGSVLYFPLTIPVLLTLTFSFASFVGSFAAWAGIEKLVLRRPEEDGETGEDTPVLPEESEIEE